MTVKTTCGLLLFSCASFAVSAQVQVSKEPRHKNVLENRYVRILDVRIDPGDTTQFHIHSTPSLFLHFTTQAVCVQVKGKAWERSVNTTGNAWYRSFVNDTLIHRVSNCDTVPFHVTDIEILSSYRPATPLDPLLFPVLFQNEKTIAYRLAGSDVNNQVIAGRGPMVAELVSGDDIFYRDAKTSKGIRLKAGGYLYIKPRSTFSFGANGKDEINLVLFEIR